MPTPTIWCNPGCFFIQYGRLKTILCWPWPLPFCKVYFIEDQVIQVALFFQDMSENPILQCHTCGITGAGGTMQRMSRLGMVTDGRETKSRMIMFSENGGEFQWIIMNFHEFSWMFMNFHHVPFFETAKGPWTHGSLSLLGQRVDLDLGTAPHGSKHLLHSKGPTAPFDEVKAGTLL